MTNDLEKEDNEDAALLSSTSVTPYRDLPKEVKDLDKKIMVEKFCSGLTLKEVAESFGISYRTIIRYSKDGGWNALKEAREAEEAEANLVSNKDRIIIEAADRTIRGLYKMATDFERAIMLGSEPTVNYKHLVDALDKAVKLKMHIDSGGVSKTEVNVNKKVQTIDWNRMIEMSVNAKKEQGDAFDEKGFLRRVIDAQATDKPKDKK